MKKEQEVYVPPILIDTVREFLNPRNTETQRFQYKTRLEAARDYCIEALARELPSRPQTKQQIRTSDGRNEVSVTFEKKGAKGTVKTL